MTRSGMDDMDSLTYNDLVNRYGKDLAFDLLLSIEKVAKTRDDTASLSEDARLQKALAALDEPLSEQKNEPISYTRRTAQ